MLPDKSTMEMGFRAARLKSLGAARAAEAAARREVLRTVTFIMMVERLFEDWDVG